MISLVSRVGTRSVQPLIPGKVSATGQHRHEMQLPEPFASAFSGHERIMTRKAAVAAQELAPGDEVLTTQGFRALTQVETQELPPQQTWLRGLPTNDPAGFRGDPRKLMLVQGAAVELMVGETRAMLQLADLADKFGRCAPGPQSPSVLLRFAQPVLIIAEQGYFASEDHGLLPPVLLPEEAAMFLAFHRSRGRRA